MGKLGNFIMIMGTSILVLYAFGFIENTFTSYLLNLLFNPTGLQTSFVWTTMMTIASLAGGLAVTAVALITKSDILLVAPFILLLLNFGADYLVVYNLLATSTHSLVALILMSPLMLLYVLTVVEWWRGVTT